MSEEQVQAARDEDITVSVVFQYLQSDWVRLVRRGLQTQFVNLEVDVEGVYGVDFDAAQQVDLLETLASKADQLDAVIVYPVDPDATVEPIRQLRAEGVEVIIITNTPPDLVHGEDFAGMVTVDNYGLGLVAARLLREMVGEGKVGMIAHEPQLYVIDERERAVREVLGEAEGIELVSNSFNEASETFDLTQNMLTANPDMAGLWSPWASPPANEAVSAIRDSGQEDLVHTTVDLNQQQAEIMASEGVTKGIGVGGPFVIGENLVKMTGHAILGNETPAYVGIGASAVVRPNLLEMYEEILREDPPEGVTSQFE
jgi:ribose transport system substrate-binding protein